MFWIGLGALWLLTAIASALLFGMLIAEREDDVS